MKHALVIFNEQSTPTIGDVASANRGAALESGQESDQIAKLETELSVARQHLQAIIEEYETSREEMKAANEEMQSSNEELRSTMEELETSKEELQSINEELQTVNQENRHKVEELSQLSSDLQNLLTATQIATLFLDRDLRILRFTPRVAELFSMRVTDRGRPISDLTHRLGYPHLRSDAEAVLHRLVPIEREIEDDSGHWYLTRVLPYRSTEDRIEGIVLTFIDITAQKKAEDAIRSSARELFADGAWLRTMLASLNDGIIATDDQARVRYLNPAAERMTGWLQSEAAGKPDEELYDLRTMTGLTVEKSQLQKALSATSAVGKERFILHARGGQTTPIEASASPILPAGLAEGAVTIIADITEHLRQERLREIERDRLEEEVQKTTDQLGQTRAELRALSAYLINAHEHERRRLAVELHDDFGQRMAALSMRINRAIEQLEKNPKETEEILQSISEEVALLNLGLREVSHRLHPSVLEHLGLLPALRSLIAGFLDDGIDVSFKLPDEIPALSTDVATALYRIAQEALRNALKHAPGAPVHTTLLTQDSYVQLTIRDDGPGFDLNQVRLGGGLGILNMNERARLVNGTLLLSSRPGDGTVVTVRVPVDKSH
jgi:two-component system, chemotaxis family, CheB/CheR fusion protein